MRAAARMSSSASAASHDASSARALKVRGTENGEGLTVTLFQPRPRDRRTRSVGAVHRVSDVP